MTAVDALFSTSTPPVKPAGKAPVSGDVETQNSEFDKAFAAFPHARGGDGQGALSSDAMAETTATGDASPDDVMEEDASTDDLLNGLFDENEIALNDVAADADSDETEGVNVIWHDAHGPDTDVNAVPFDEADFALVDTEGQALVASEARAASTTESVVAASAAQIPAADRPRYASLAQTRLSFLTASGPSEATQTAQGTEAMSASHIATEGAQAGGTRLDVQAVAISGAPAVAIPPSQLPQLPDAPRAPRESGQPTVHILPPDETSPQTKETPLPAAPAGAVLSAEGRSMMPTSHTNPTTSVARAAAALEGDEIPSDPVSTETSEDRHDTARSLSDVPRAARADGEGARSIVLRQTVSAASTSPEAVVQTGVDVQKEQSVGELWDEIETISSLSSSPASSTSAGTATAQAILSQRPDLPRYVSVQLAQNAGAATNRPIELALNPPELGKVRLSMSLEDGRAQVVILAERAETNDLLRRNIDMLAQEFHDMGYGEATFSFAERREGAAQAALDADGRSIAEEDEVTVALPVAESASLASLPSVTDRVDIRL